MTSSVDAGPSTTGSSRARQVVSTASQNGYWPGRFGGERFDVADELTCYYDRRAEPANVHLEVRVPGKLDPSELRAAVRAVLQAEPGVMVRQSAGGPWRSGFYWEFAADPDVDPVITASYAGDAELAGLRSALLSRPIPLRTSPPLRFLLASGPGGDALILTAHHARFDGLSCLRLVRSVAQQYSVQIGGRRAAAEADHRRLATALTPAVGAQAAVAPTRTRPGRIAKIAREPQPGPAAARLGYGAHHVAWDGLAAANRLRPAGVSVNDVLIAAMMVTIAGWNHAHGTKAGLIAITMPVGDRAQAGADGRWANTSRLTTVTARLASGEIEPAGLLGDVAGQTRYAKDHPGAQVGLVSRAITAAPVPVAVKLLGLRTALALAGPFFCDSSLVSNLGVTEPLAFGSEVADQLMFSTFAHMPRGLSLGTATLAGRLHLTFRYRRALLTDAAAAAFADRYCRALDVLTGRGTTT
jgi:NRPS condensation-like uncharacterized protein